MENLTKEQQSIIDNLVSEFSKLNETKKTKTNLLGISELKKEKEQALKIKQAVESHNKTMFAISKEKNEKIISNLQDELADTGIEVYGFKLDTNSAQIVFKIPNTQKRIYIMIERDVEVIEIFGDETLNKIISFHYELRNANNSLYLVKGETIEDILNSVEFKGKFERLFAKA